mmetsp:Transcript_16869/g.39208  ORF Transcript_16869/g.39208 Transcript_16869/m.39208 type:complete len:478 (+) Transcript_16869:83-1516(+)
MCTAVLSSRPVHAGPGCRPEMSGAAGTQVEEFRILRQVTRQRPKAPFIASAGLRQPHSRPLPWEPAPEHVEEQRLAAAKAQATAAMRKLARSCSDLGEREQPALDSAASTVSRAYRDRQSPSETEVGARVATTCSPGLARYGSEEDNVQPIRVSLPRAPSPTGKDTSSRKTTPRRRQQLPRTMSPERGQVGMQCPSSGRTVSQPPPRRTRSSLVRNGEGEQTLLTSGHAATPSKSAKTPWYMESRSSPVRGSTPANGGSPRHGSPPPSRHEPRHASPRSNGTGPCVWRQVSQGRLEIPTPPAQSCSSPRCHSPRSHSNPFDPRQFVEAQKDSYPRALKEIQSGRKCSCWMWFIIPTPPHIVNRVELGSSVNRKYALRTDEEAIAYLSYKADGIDLRKNYLEIISAVRDQLRSGKQAVSLLGHLDEPKLRSSARFFERITYQIGDDELNGVLLEVLDLLQIDRERPTRCEPSRRVASH